MTSVRSLLGPSLDRVEPPTIRFRIVAGVVTLLFAGLWLYEGHYLFTAWLPPLFDDLTPINGVAAGAFMSLMFACSILVLVRPRRALGPFRLLLVGGVLLVILLPMAFLLSEPLFTAILFIIGVALLGGLYITYPGRERVLPTFDPNYPMLLAGLLVAIPFAIISLELLYNQLTLDDAIAQRWFYGGFALYLSVIMVYAVVASLHRETRLLFAAGACFLAAMLGLVSIVYPAEINSLGHLGGGLVLLWAGAFALLTRWT